MSTLSNINAVLIQYEETGSKMHLSQLLDLQDKLSIWSYRLADEAAEAKNTYNSDLFTRKITINRQIQSMLNAKLTKAAATVQAESSKVGEEMIKAELDAEAYAYKLDLLLGQVNRVLSAMQQRVSYLKTEKQHAQA